MRCRPDSATELARAFIADFRATRRPFTAGAEPCAFCPQPAQSYCENCEVALCAGHADSETYDDVDICVDQAACEQRLESAQTSA